MSQEPTAISELEAAYKAVEKLIRFQREILHKLDCVYEDLDEFLTKVNNDPMIGVVKNRIGECRLLGRLVLKGLEE